MEAKPAGDGTQAALWNGSAARGWTGAQDLLEAMYRPLEAVLADAAGPGARVLDIGCGTGPTTLAVARRVGPAGRCVGVDVSAPMLEAAEERAARAWDASTDAPVTFVRADAATHPFEPAGFDLLVSRFGVMFFEDVRAAFAHLRQAGTDAARLRFVTWRGVDENPFMTTAERAVASLLPRLPPRVPDAPGQFGLARPDLVRGSLESAGWGDVDIQPLDLECAFPATELDRYLALLGPVGRALQEADDETRAKVIETARVAFEPYLRGGEVRFTAACWRIDARAA